MSAEASSWTSNNSTKAKIRIFPRTKKGDLKKLHKTRGRAPLTFDIDYITSLFDVPQEKAAKTLGISLAAIKRACRQLGIERWPYKRPRKSGSASPSNESDNSEAADVRLDRDAPHVASSSSSSSSSPSLEGRKPLETVMPSFQLVQSSPKNVEDCKLPSFLQAQLAENKQSSLLANGNFRQLARPALLPSIRSDSVLNAHLSSSQTFNDALYSKTSELIQSLLQLQTLNNSPFPSPPRSGLDSGRFQGQPVVLGGMAPGSASPASFFLPRA
ncbi:hypothetical protein GUITHDRAFT_103020 [Guillardia theta CCMP2712]|uniref:RWP-RK domain-containing protein n=1 Tax=Guillardia theta (strain CCMP2712) TaxID=905079 RepID=L1JRA7_GUITC|nr:hypothetical protein GUITHDRAFT_103020 [Guillardia theta CCMP2712]EKX51101.1 hypothetical protein GUITHDRAFT_103020 [Guillardia theta CCMP2712]|eukprot:XP_005838081.1 hypothetical protein GUITHDRAFT_103020 [Guillardia theta CCMP2712]